MNCNAIGEVAHFDGGFERPDSLDFIGVVIGKVMPGTEADLQYASLRARHHLAPLIGNRLGAHRRVEKPRQDVLVVESHALLPYTPSCPTIYSGSIFFLIQAVSSSSLNEPAATEINARNDSSATRAIRLFPSTKGWFIAWANA
jgi:hypothetical protein